MSEQTEMTAPRWQMICDGASMHNDEAAAYIGCTADTLRVWTSKRMIPFIKVNRLTRFLKADLDQYLQALSKNSP